MPASLSVCVCVCVCMCVCVCVCVLLRMCACQPAASSTLACTPPMYTYKESKQNYVSAYAHTYTLECTPPMYVCMYICMYVYIYTHIYIYIYIYIYNLFAACGAQKQRVLLHMEPQGRGCCCTLRLVCTEHRLHASSYCKRERTNGM